MEQIYYNKFLTFPGKYHIILLDLLNTIDQQNKKSLNRDYYIIKGISCKDYIKESKKNKELEILDLAKNGSYLFHFPKNGLVNALKECQRGSKILEYNKDIEIIFQRINMRYLKIWSKQNTEVSNNV